MVIYFQVGNSMKRVVLKFGGSSVASLEKMQAVAKQIIKRYNNQEQIIVVVSAMGLTTNQLLDLVKKVAKYPVSREVDMLLATGEQLSSALLSIIINDYKIPSISLCGFQAGIKTIGEHQTSEILEVDPNNIEKYLSQGKVVVVAGFQGMNEKGDITTIGRGGSDTTAIALAARLKCPCEIYTDVDGIYVVDPKIFPTAKRLNEISYQMLSEMAVLGAKVIATPAIKMAQQYEVPLWITAAHPEGIGTKVTNESLGHDLICLVISNDTKNSLDSEIRFSVVKMGINNDDLDKINQLLENNNLHWAKIDKSINSVSYYIKKSMLDKMLSVISDEYNLGGK